MTFSLILTGKRAGKIINRDIEKERQKSSYNNRPPPPPEIQEDVQEDNDNDITDLMKNPSKVVLLKVKVIKFQLRSPHTSYHLIIQHSIESEFAGNGREAPSFPHQFVNCQAFSDIDWQCILSNNVGITLIKTKRPCLNKTNNISPLVFVISLVYE